MDSTRWDALRIAGMENGWLVDPDEVGWFNPSKASQENVLSCRTFQCDRVL